MWAENSNPDGEGATFSFSLPINDVKSAIDWNTNVNLMQRSWEDWSIVGIYGDVDAVMLCIFSSILYNAMSM